MNIHSVDRELLQLGNRDGFSNAIGDKFRAKRDSIEGQHKICTNKCKVMHPFNKSKLTSCKDACNNQRTARLNEVSNQEVVEATLVEQEGNEGGAVALSKNDIDIDSETKAGISPKTILIGVGVLAVIGGIIYFIKRKK